MELNEMIRALQQKIGANPDGLAGPATWTALYKRIADTPVDGCEIDQMIIAIQQKLGLTADGKPGPATWTAIYQKLIGPVPAPAPAPATIDRNSEAILAGMQKEVAPLARKLVMLAAAQGISIRIISGLRTYAEQDALYAQGRTKPGNIVTNAPAGYSNHNFGLAFDIGVFDASGKYQGNSPLYAKVGPLGESIGLAWGGRWKTMPDPPHYELRPVWAKAMSEGAMVTELRRRKAAGIPLLT